MFQLIKKELRSRRFGDEQWYRFDGFENYSVCVTVDVKTGYTQFVVFNQCAMRFNPEVNFVYGESGDGIRPTDVSIRVPHDHGGMTSLQEVSAFVASIQRAAAAAEEIRKMFVQNWPATKESADNSDGIDTTECVPGKVYKVRSSNANGEFDPDTEPAICGDIFSAIMMARTLADGVNSACAEVSRDGCENVVYFCECKTQNCGTSLNHDDEDYQKVSIYTTNAWQSKPYVRIC